jgi:hypothetical protein
MKMCFVFGSNESGVHGAGAAASGYHSHGAKIGQGFGLSGSSFAIPTKDWRIQPLPIVVVSQYVDRFLVFARFNPERLFQVTAIGCGLAGFKHKDIAPLFKYAPPNCRFDEVWKEFLPQKLFWGTYG